MILQTLTSGSPTESGTLTASWWSTHVATDVYLFVLGHLRPGHTSIYQVLQEIGLGFSAQKGMHAVHQSIRGILI